MDAPGGMPGTGPADDGLAGDGGALDIVIPSLNARATLASTLAAVAGTGQVIIADGGSSDGTASLARASGALVVEAARGRGQQLAVGAAAGSAPWILFLHADTCPQPGWLGAVERFQRDPANRARAGYFRLRFDSARPQARRVERMVAWRCRALGLPYGDQGLLIARSFYEQLGGHRPLPLMEDVDLARRIGAGRLVALDADALTSAARYERDGWWLRPARNLALLFLWYAGLPPRIIRRLYG